MTIHLTLSQNLGHIDKKHQLRSLSVRRHPSPRSFRSLVFDTFRSFSALILHEHRKTETFFRVTVVAVALKLSTVTVLEILEDLICMVYVI